jgi:hypothetical protein
LGLGAYDLQLELFEVEYDEHGTTTVMQPLIVGRGPHSIVYRVVKANNQY